MISLATRFLKRDRRAGELRTLGAALIISVAAVTAIGLLTDRLGKSMKRESAELIGGDLVIESTRPPNPDWLAAGKSRGMTTATIYDFNSVLLLGENILLCHVKAVSANYPLRGSLRIASELYGQDREIRHPPRPGTIWVDTRVLSRLNAQIGGDITLGATSLRIDAVLTYEPDQASSLFRLAPRVIMHEADLERAEVLGPGSRIRYKYLFAGEQAPALKKQLESQMSPGHKLEDIHNNENGAADALSKATQFLNLTALLTVFLAAVAIAMSARRYSERHYDNTAMLRCLGMTQHRITQLYLLQLGLLVAVATVFGSLLGWGSHWLLLLAIKPLLPPFLPTAGSQPWLMGIGTALILTAGFALPPVLRLRHIPPLRVLRRDLAPMPISGWVIYGAALGSLCSMILLLLGNALQILLGLSIALILLCLTGSLVYWGLRYLRQLRPARLRRGLAGRSLRNLSSQAATSTSQILAFGLTLMIMALIAQLRTDLLDRWRLQLPENVPNLFAFNILPGSVDAFSSLLANQGIDTRFYPVVRGRLVGVNGGPVEISEEKDTNRELNLTWTTLLPDDNHITAGQWLTADDRDSVSIEAKYAERLNVGLGDRLSLNVGGFNINATITSLRTLEWESFSPNFFLIFSPDVLTNLPTTYLTSFHLKEEQKPLLKQIIAQFPSTSLIEVDAILQRLSLIFNQVSLAVEMMMVFTLLAGLMVLFAALYASADARTQQGALLRALGASRGYLRNACVTEFALLGLLAGLLAAIGTELAVGYLYRNVFNLDYILDWRLWVFLPFLAALIISTAGYIGSRQVLEVSPAKLLAG